jgi:uncharacterized membrane protein YjgN (DUF898 family)
MDSESETQTIATNSLHYSGSGTELAILMFKNIFLTIITLGIYAPWARTNTRRYLWGHTLFLNDRAAYTGTGVELFRGWIIVFGVYLAIIAIVKILTSIHPALTFLLMPLYAYLFSIVVYSGTRYRFARTKWREIHFGLDKDKKQSREFILLFMKGIALSFLTLGFYYPFHIHHTRKFLTDRSRFGNQHFSYIGDASTLFWIMARGFLLTGLTLGFFAPWNFITLTSYRLNNTKIGEAKLNLTLRGSQLFFYSLCSYLLVLVTLGLALPWVINWGHKLITDALVVEGNIDLANIHNIESEGDSYADVAAMEYNIDLGF